MIKNLVFARRQSERFRFDGDFPSEANIDDVGGLTQARGQLYQDAIEISPLLVPELHRRFRVACERLEVPDDLITPFIYSSQEIQAECYASGNGCIIRFSSSLIGLLSDAEFEFVVGHELGHFLLDHHSANAQTDQSSLEYFRKRRSQEISCDRIGLIACSSLDTALRALMKTVSGLTDRHLRFDFLAYVTQLRKVEASAIDASLTTHPSTLIRAKALLWFSLSDFMTQKAGSPGSSVQLKQIDERVRRDLDKFVDRTIREKIANLKRDLLLWMVATEIVRLGAFSTALQSQMLSRFDRETVDKLRSFLGSLPKVSAESVVFEKMVSARNELERLVPGDIVEQVSALNEQCRDIIEGRA
jgi:Peptidase family M48